MVLVRGGKGSGSFWGRGGGGERCVGLMEYYGGVVGERRREGVCLMIW